MMTLLPEVYAFHISLFTLKQTHFHDRNDDQKYIIILQLYEVHFHKLHAACIIIRLMNNLLITCI
jgi:hypothetical protein